VLVSIVFVFLAGFVCSAQVLYPNLRDELLSMEKVDQDARMKCANGSADEQVKCLAPVLKAIDEPHTKRL